MEDIYLMEDLYYDLECPNLDLGEREGWTQYIDFITWDEVIAPVMKGIDCTGRKFIVIKFIVNQTRIMQTFFQRYTGGSGWMGCGHATTNLIDTSGGLRDNQAEFIRNVIEEKRPILTEDLSPCLEMLIDYPVDLYDERKINAVLVIQKAWKKCRYDPKYRMCHTIQNKNLDLILGIN